MSSIIDTQHSKLGKPTNMGQKGIIDHVKQVELRLPACKASCILYCDATKAASKFTTTGNPSLLRVAPTLPLSDIVMSHQCSPDLGQLIVKNALSVIPAEVYIIHDQHHK
ncbi:hypothetical protein I312_102770 [Cryptococcus bacillisporus CA1280]|uniref:uncharacterized protein n=1 Tax=Cryptococcus bacillisporus CA1280 TaxID=1296109 RepID=UPI0033693930